MEVEKKGEPKLVIQDMRYIEFPVIGGTQQVLEIKVAGVWTKVRVENYLTFDE